MRLSTAPSDTTQLRICSELQPDTYFHSFTTTQLFQQYTAPHLLFHRQNKPYFLQLLRTQQKHQLRIVSHSTKEIVKQFPTDNSTVQIALLDNNNVVLFCLGSDAEITLKLLDIWSMNQLNSTKIGGLIMYFHYEFRIFPEKKLICLLCSNLSRTNILIFNRKLQMISNKDMMGLINFANINDFPKMWQTDQQILQIIDLETSQRRGIMLYSNSIPESLAKEDIHFVWEYEPNTFCVQTKTISPPHPLRFSLYSLKVDGQDISGGQLELPERYRDMECVAATKNYMLLRFYDENDFRVQVIQIAAGKARLYSQQVDLKKFMIYAAFWQWSMQLRGDKILICGDQQSPRLHKIEIRFDYSRMQKLIHLLTKNNWYRLSNEQIGFVLEAIDHTS